MAETDETEQGPPAKPGRTFLDALLLLTPFTPKSDMMRWPLERHVRKGWRNQARIKAMYQTTVWLKAAGWCALLGAILAGIIDQTTGSLAGLVLLVPAIPCLAQALRWLRRAGKHGKGWRDRVVREASERLAQTDPDRPW